MQDGALGLQPRPQQIQGVDNGSADGTADGADRAGGDIPDGDVLLVAAVQTGFAGQEEGFEVLEDEEVDGRVGEHAC
jgi:hypothetical protein